MNNNTIQNNGNQYFQENNFYGSNYVHYKTEDCIASVQKVGKLSWAVIAAILGMIADIIPNYPTHPPMPISHHQEQAGHIPADYQLPVR